MMVAVALLIVTGVLAVWYINGTLPRRHRSAERVRKAGP